MLIAAFDPGNTGALGMLDTESEAVAAFDLPLITIGNRELIDPYALSATLREHRPDEIWIELVGARPGQGLSSTGKFLYSAGVLWGVAGALNIPVTFCTPQAWKKEAGLIGMDKEAGRQLALRLYPHAAPFLTRKKDHGRADAILIARYGATAPRKAPRKAQRKAKRVLH